MKLNERLFNTIVELADEVGCSDVGLLLYRTYAGLSRNDDLPTGNRPLTPEERDTCVCYAGAKGDLWVYEFKHDMAFNLDQYRTWVYLMRRVGAAAKRLAEKGLSKGDVIAVMRSMDAQPKDKAA